MTDDDTAAGTAFYGNNDNDNHYDEINAVVTVRCIIIIVVCGVR